MVLAAAPVRADAWPHGLARIDGFAHRKVGVVERAEILHGGEAGAKRRLAAAVRRAESQVHVGVDQSRNHCRIVIESQVRGLWRGLPSRADGDDAVTS